MKQSDARPPLPLPREAVNFLLATLCNSGLYDLHDAVVLILELGLTQRQLENLRWSSLRFPAGKVVIECANQSLLLPSSPAVERVFESRKMSSDGRDLVFNAPMHSLNQQLESHSIQAGLGLITLSTIRTQFIQTLLSKLRTGKLIDFVLLARIS